MSTISKHFLTVEQIADYQHDGFLLMRSLFSPEETAALRDHFMKIQREALVEGSQAREHYQPANLEAADGDILKHFPRVMMPHRFDSLSKQYFLDARVGGVLRDLFGEEPLAAQSMHYFKPPGARGQALHQDDFYLQTSPGHCMAAWTALDDADSENGTLFIVPGSHVAGVLCPHAADLSTSFTTEEVDVPAGMEPIELQLTAGDVLFFNGSVIHGSYPNATTDRFRRAFICHYVPNSMMQMSAGYYPLHAFDGQTVERESAEGGGICGNEEWEAFQKGVEAQMSKVQDNGGSQAKAALEWIKESARA